MTEHTSFTVKYKGIPYEILIDYCDLDTISQFSWGLNTTKSGRLRVFGRPCGRNKVYLHRYILGFPEGVVDHINGNSLDNRRCNLRIVTQQHNTQNRRFLNKNNTSGVMGVSWNSLKKRWVARVYVGPKVFSRSFKTFEEAELSIVELRRTHLPFSKEAENG